MLPCFAVPLALALTSAPRQVSPPVTDCDSARTTGGSISALYTESALTEKLTKLPICVLDEYQHRLAILAQKMATNLLVYRPEHPDTLKSCYAEGFYTRLLQTLAAMTARCAPDPLFSCIPSDIFATLSASAFAHAYITYQDPNAFTSSLIAAIYAPLSILKDSSIQVCMPLDANACAATVTDRLRDYGLQSVGTEQLLALTNAVCGYPTIP